MDIITEKLIQAETQSFLLNVCKHFAGEEAEDLRQNVMYNVLGGLHTYKEDISIRSWLYTAVRNQYINEYRRKKLRSFSDYKPESTCTIFDELACEEILQAVDRLRNKKQQTAIKLRIQGFSYEEIAEDMNLPIGYVKPIIYHARKALEKVLK